MTNRFLHQFMIFFFCVFILLTGFFFIGQVELKAQYYDEPPGGGGGKESNFCKSWQNIYLNNCSKEEFYSVPRHQDCITNTTQVVATLNCDSRLNCIWRLANTDPSIECKYAKNWSSFAPFTSPTVSVPWNLSSGAGEKKVCLFLEYFSGGSAIYSFCNAQIEFDPSANPTPSPTPIPAPWYKIKNGSFYKNGAISLSIPTTINSFDLDDTGQSYLVIGNAGIVFSTSTISFNNPGFKTNINEWESSYYERNYSLNLIDNFIDYTKSRKEYQSLSILEDNGSNLVGNKVNILNSGADLSLTNNHLSAAPESFVLIVQGNININEDFNSGLTPKSIAIIASGNNTTLTFDEGVTKAGGIFIAPKIVIKDATNSADGLKIKGNLISGGAATLLRDRDDNSIPSYFIVFDPKMYLDLLPLLSVSTYDWQQTQ